ncbi:MAG: NAD(P)H-hydrate dehydratase, partial [Methyloceanibacter sp.]|nr:NAD(P)H-hydrate dehydratase [Methyloceanibacter sp.]
ASVLATTTVVCGCGGGDRVREALPALLSHAGRLVLDADALNAVAEDSQLQSMLASRTGRGLDTVLTPHPLEAARLLQRSAAEVQADRLDAARLLAQRWSCVVVLKGSGTIVAAPGHLPTIIGSGNALLATAGTGDVLAGMVVGLLAQAMPAFEAASAAVWLHGAAAIDFGPGLIAEDLPETLPSVLRALQISGKSRGSGGPISATPQTGQ